LVRTSTGSATYLSDAAPSAAANGYGPLETDTSNGENGFGDGEPLSLDGTPYLRGLGAHAASRVGYVLSRECARFRASVGIDDEVGPRGSVIFRVFADGRNIYDSGVMTGTSATRFVDVSVAGATQLQLVVAEAGDGFRYDHADWADARLVCGIHAHPRFGSGLGVLSSDVGLSLLGLVLVGGALSIGGVLLTRRR
jgi:hypothetical protein